jgi:hypothetical protein
MFTCSNCGASVREGARFCTSCGTRLNDTTGASAESTWDASTSAESVTPAEDGSAATDEATATRVNLASDESAAEASSVTETSDVSPAEDPVGNSLDEIGTPADDTPAPDDAFTWSWGKPVDTDETPSSDNNGQLEVESGVLVQERASATDQEPDTIVDATEIEILEEEPTVTDDDRITEEQARAHDQAGDVEIDVVTEESSDGEGAETLAAWAEQWNEPESGNEQDAPSSPGASATSDDGEPEAVKEDEEEEEDTVAKAERLIGELRAVIPTLVRPRPAQPVAPGDSAAIADELTRAAKAGNFDDLREALETVRDNPRDIDSMLKLSGQADRLLALLDDRNALATTADSAASQLRGTTKPTVS